LWTGSSTHEIRFTSGETGGKGWAESGVETATHEQQDYS
jgi:hypothetical protein